MMWKVGKTVAIKRLYQQVATQAKCLPCGVINVDVLLDSHGKKGNWTLLQRQ